MSELKKGKTDQLEWLKFVVWVERGDCDIHFCSKLKNTNLVGLWRRENKILAVKGSYKIIVCNTKVK
jgi:hypothetical protein